MSEPSAPNGHQSKQKHLGGLAKAVLIVGIAFLLVTLFITMQSRSPVAGQAPTQSVNPPPGDTVPAVDSTPEEAVPEHLASPGPPAQAKKMVATDRMMVYVPGALVCPNYETTKLVSDSYQQSWDEKLQDAVTGGQSKDIRGESQSAPDPRDYDCILVKPGTRMLLQDGKLVPVVYVQTPKGWVRGITIGAMMITEEQAAKVEADRKTYETFVKSLQDLKPDFERQLQTLPAPARDLRVYQATNGTVYVSPFGPCAVLREDESGFDVTTYDLFALHLWGPFQTRPEAEMSAMNACSQYSAVEANKHHSQTDYWFLIAGSPEADLGNSRPGLLIGSSSDP